MELIKLLTNVNSLKDYVTLTQKIVKNISNLKVKLTIDTFKALNSIASFELEYFNRYNKSGAAPLILELLLQQPPSRAWRVVGQQLVHLIQYWLCALRKHLILNNGHWWKFLKKILNIVQQLCLKDSVIIPWIMHLNESFLDLATRTEPSLEQQYQIIQCFNTYCGLAPRELRYSLKDQYDTYFTRLAARLAACGDAAVQHALLETLLRWLLPRHDPAARHDAAERWCLRSLCNSHAVQLFLERTWISFAKDARSFLNAINESNDNIVSVLCNKFFVGDVPVVGGMREHWLDLNCGSSCISMILDTALYKALKVQNVNPTVCSALVITYNNTQAVEMYSGPSGLFISLKVTDPLQMYQSKVLENKHEVKVVVSSRSNIDKIDKALRTIFENKYQLRTDSHLTINDAQEKSQSSDRRQTSRFIEYISEEDTRFSNPPDILRQKLLERRTLSEQLPKSLESTSSLSMIVEPLNDFEFPERVESEEDQANPDINSKNITSGAPLDTQGNKDDVIAAPVDIIDLLAQEALNYSRPEESQNKYDCNSNVVDNTYYAPKTRSRQCDIREFNHKPTIICDATTDESNTAFVENTPAVHVTATNRISTKERDITTDSKDSGFGQQNFDSKIVETFFLQHIAEDKHGDVIVSPTLARRINDSNSDSDETFTIRTPVKATLFRFNYTDVVECLGYIIDKVAVDSEKHVENMSRHLEKNNILNNNTTEAGLPEAVPLEEVTNIREYEKIPAKQANIKTKPVQGINLKFKNSTKKKNTGKKNIPEKETDKKNNPISENVNGVIDSRIANSELREKNSTFDELKTPKNKISNKRKLYSTKDDDLISAQMGMYISETEEDNSILPECKTLHKSPVATATPYKDLEKYRQSVATRQLRIRVAKNIPKTENMNSVIDQNKNLNSVFDQLQDTNSVFDQLKYTANNTEKVMTVDMGLVNKHDVFNFTSSGEDDGVFKKKKIVTRSTVNKKQRGRNKPKNKSDVTKNKSNNTKNIAKRTRSKVQHETIAELVKSEPTIELLDERMRENPEILNTSLVIESRKEDVNINLEPMHKKPKMEILLDDNQDIATVSVKSVKKRSQNTMQRSKRRKPITPLYNNNIDDESKTISPLPGLEIETAQKLPELDNSIVLLEKMDGKHVFKDLAQKLITESELLLDSPIRNEGIIRKNKRSAKTKMNKNKRVRKRRLSSSSSDSLQVKENVVVVLDKFDIHTPRSIASSMEITAHGVEDEPPPQVNEINTRISPRSLETEELSEDVISYHHKLTDGINGRLSVKSQESDHVETRSTHTPRDNRKQESEDTRISPNNSQAEKSMSSIFDKTPVVSIVKLSQKELDRYLHPSKNEVSIPSSKKRSTRENAQKARKSIISPITLTQEWDCKESSKSIEAGDDSFLKTFEKGFEPCINQEKGKRTSVRVSSKARKKLNLDSSEEIQPSISSVNSWFKRNEHLKPSCTEESFAKEEILSTVIEKVNTTLLEHHYSMKKLLVKAVVETRSELNRASEEREAQLVSTFSSLKRRFKEADKILSARFEKKTRNIIVEDLKKKADFMELLKEDIRATLYHTERRNGKNEDGNEE